MLHFKPILTTLLQKIPYSGGVLASKTWTCYGVCKNFGAQHPLGAKIWFSEKINLVGKA